MKTERINKKEFHKSKQPVDLASVNVDQVVISGKFKHSDEDFKYFIGYKKDEIVKPLCIILPQMDILNILKTVVKICHFLLKMMTYCINITKLGTRLKKN